MSEAAIPASTKSAADANTQQLNDLIADAEYVCLELARGDAVPVEVLTKAKTLIDPVVQALLPAKATLKEKGAPTDEEARNLEKAMVSLSEAIAPVSVQSLRDTATSGGTRRGVYMFRWLNSFLGLHEDLSLADRFSDGFMAVTVAFLIAALACSVVIPPDTAANVTKTGQTVAVSPQEKPTVKQSTESSRVAAPVPPGTGVTAPPTGQPKPQPEDKAAKP